MSAGIWQADYYCTKCGWSFIDNLTSGTTVICHQCYGSSFSTEKPQRPPKDKAGALGNVDAARSGFYDPL